MDIRWEDPAPRGGRTDWKGIVEVLRSRPGVWALISENLPAHAATTLRRYPGVKVTTRDITPQGTVKIYARWEGTDASTSP